MGSGPALVRSRRAIDSSEFDTYEGRAFLREHLGLFGLWVFFLSFGFYATNLNGPVPIGFCRIC